MCYGISRPQASLWIHCREARIEGFSFRFVPGEPGRKGPTLVREMIHRLYYHVQEMGRNLE